MSDQKLLNRFKEALKKEGLKYTPQRTAVLEEIIKNKGHRESEEIYLALKKRGQHVSRATVYRTMDILVNNGFARKMNLGDGRARYESKVNSPHHDHLVCMDCGLIVEFMDQKIAWMTVIEGDADFTAMKVTNKTDRQEIIESYKKGTIRSDNKRNSNLKLINSAK